MVVDGLLLDQSGSTFVMPFEYVREIFELSADEISSVHGTLVATIRGEPYSAVPLGDLLELKTTSSPPHARRTGVSISCKAGDLVLLVDAVIGQRKVVVNSLNDVLNGIDKIGGIAQLGGGQLALVLNAPELVKGLRRDSTNA